jgi:uncharacterized membrane protein
MYNQQYSVEPASTVNQPPLPVNVGNFERVATVLIGAFLFYNGLRRIGRKPIKGITRAAAGGALVFRGITGFCPFYDKLKIDGTMSQSVNIRETFVVDKPRMEVYHFWRRLENLPLFMKHLANVREIDSRHSHWEAKLPEGNPMTIKWDAEIVKEDEGNLLSWKSLPGSTIDNAGKIEFHDALGRQGTELRVMITYRPPAGNIGSGIAKLLNPIFEKMVRNDINNFKSFIDARPVTTT